ncbi:MAG TPA: AbrB/MazE/SpoVT family DNA-binding domain-containing protein [archaeon]|nr:AbrB/MazE/SpoVT family DNA-binding domain-containing protein [archaeon]
MAVEMTRMSSKGQVVIPLAVREAVHAGEGTLFVALGTRDAIVLKKVETPSKEQLIKDLEGIAREGRKRLEQRGLKESDIPMAVKRVRGR